MDVYEVLEPVGQGTFGEVHKAIDTRTGQLVALKRVRLRNLDGGSE